VLNPELTAGFVVAFLVDGRFSPPKDVEPVRLPDDAGKKVVVVDTPLK
jgi:hypothetical protein